MFSRRRHPGLSNGVAAFFIFLAFFAAAAHAEAPRLVALVVIDQMIPRYLEKFGTFKDNALIFPNTKLNYVPTQTAPGHATIVTGEPPSVHGIVGNEWFDPSKKQKVPSTVAVINGEGPFHLKTDTLGDVLKKKSKKSKVISISMKNRSAIIMGGKDADAVAWFRWQSRRFVTSPYYKNTDLWLAQINSQIKNSIPSWLKLPDFLRSPACDRVLLEAVKLTVDTFELGKDEFPDLLLISFSGTDNIGHRYGPDSPEMNAQLESLDKILNELVRTLDRAANNDFVLILTSDHGVLPVPEEAAGRKMNAVRVKKNAFIKKMENVLARSLPGGPWIANYATTDLWFDRKRMQAAHKTSSDFFAEAAKELRTLPEVAQVYTPPLFPETDAFTNIYKRSYFEGRSGDLMIRLNPGVLISHESNGTSHGSPYDYDAVVPIVFYGKGIAPKIVSKTVSMEDVFFTGRDILELAPRPSNEGADTGHSLTENFSKN